MKKRFTFLAMSLLLALTLVSLPVPATAGPAIIYVDSDASGGNDGTSWADAYNDLQDALAEAEAGDQIWVAEGIYKPTSDILREATFVMKNWVEVYGGFDGTETKLSERNSDPVSNSTILSGDIGSPEDNSDNVFHVITAGSGIISSTVLDRFTITDGNADGPDSYSFGAGMYNRGGNRLILTDCIFSDNSAANNGGGMYNRDSISLTLTNCIFSGNWAGSYGGGMYNYSSSPTLADCIFSGNSAAINGGGMSNYEGSNPVMTDCTFSGNSSDSYGGGIFDEYSNPTLTDCTFSDNMATFQGGGMYNFSSSPLLADCTFSGNTATDPSGNPGIDPQGGGMYNRDSSNPTLTDCIFSDNSSDYSGGGMMNLNSSNPVLTGCIFSENSTAYWGGGMINFGSSPTLTDCSFSGNSVHNGDGGGMYNYQGSNTMLTNCTFSDNSATGFGGGMGNESSIPMVTGCTFSGNSANNYGGGMSNYNEGNPVLINCTFSGNSSNTYGGGLGNKSSDPTLTGCIFSGNLASYGGGFGDSSSNPVLTNCIFSGNSSQYGGGMYNELSNPILINCTLSKNSASTQGGGVYNYSDSSPELTNCILWGNSDSDGTDESDQIYTFSGTPVVNFCCIQGWSGALGGTGNIGEDPLFIDADGPDNIAGNADDDLWLSEGSPCIDAGTNDGAPDEDIEGNLRPVDGDGNSIAAADMGAFEYSNSIIKVTSIPAGASFALSGAASYSGTTPWSVSDVPVGEYTIVWGDLEGYTKPSGETIGLIEGGRLNFEGVYIESPAGAGTIDVTSTPAGMGFTINGPASYTGTTPWSVNDAPFGEYTLTWDTMEGYDTPSSQTYTLAQEGAISFNDTYKSRDNPSGSGSLSGGAIAGIVIGSCACLAAIFFAIRKFILKGRYVPYAYR